MGLVIPPYDILASQTVTSLVDIDNAAEDALNLPVQLDFLYGLWFNVSPDAISRADAVSTVAHQVKHMELPIEDYNGTAYYINPIAYRVYLELLRILYARREAYVRQQHDLLTTEFGYGTVTRRDIYWKEWLGLGSNLTVDIPMGFTREFAEIHAAFSHADIVIGGADNNEATVAAGTSYRTAICNIPVTDDTYFEVDISSNTGVLYIGVATRDHVLTNRVGYGGVSYGVRVSNKSITHTVYDGVEYALSGGSLDCSAGAGFTLNRVCLRVAPLEAKLYVSKDGNTYPDFAEPAGGLTLDLLPGLVYPAVTLYDTTSVAKFRFGNTSSLCSNYMVSSAYTNESENMGEGVYILRHDTRDLTLGHPDILP